MQVLTSSSRPNILIIHADQHRKDCLGAYGNRQIKTPHLDTLAAEGVLHTKHYCSYPVCTPSRYSLLSGQYVHQHLGWSNYCTLPAGMPTFPKLLEKAGYHTAAVGKMHFTPTYMDAGFASMTLAEQDGPGRFEDDYHDYLRKQGLLDEIDLFDQRSEYRAKTDEDYWQSFGAQKSNLPLEHHSTTYITREASKEIATWQDGGNLLMVGYIKPHHPFDPPAPYADLYDPDQLELLPGYTPEIHDASAKGKGYFENSRLSEAALRHVMALYYGTITQIDDSVGQLIKQLKEKQLYDKTIIVYTSDHGDYMGYHHLLLKGNRMFEPLMNIPLIVKPIENQAGMCDQLSSNTDLAGYLLKACGLEPSSGMSVYDLMSDKQARPYVIAESGHGSGQVSYMVRDQRYKLLLEGAMDAVVLYDLEEDPCELEDIASREGSAPIIERLKQALFDEVLFKAPSSVHVDVKAPVISQIDPDCLERRRQRLLDWHQEVTGIEPDL